MGVTELGLHGVYMICYESSIILRYNATTHQRLADIDIKGMRLPHSIVACEQTSQLYVADIREYIWRMSPEGDDIKSVSDTLKPWSLSVTSTRLLVTSQATNQLIQLDAEGDELRRVQLPDEMVPWHAVESPAGTFIIRHYIARLNRHQVCEVNTDGKVLRQFSGSRLSSLGHAPHFAVDSRGNVFVPDFHSCRVLLLDAQLTLRRCIIDEHQLNYKQPRRLCYTEQTGQLLVAVARSVAVFDVLRR